jgi:hypothetical protein
VGRFAIDQIWKKDKLEGAVIETCDDGRNGVVNISDYEGNFVQRYSGPCSIFEDAGWVYWGSRQSVVGQSSRVFPPPVPNINRGRTVQYVDFGFTSAREYWDEVVIPAYECFKENPSRGNAIIASLPAWHIQDWIWHENHLGEDTRNNKDYTQFQNKLFDDCPQLPWIHDVADASKHRGLRRATLKVREIRNNWPLNTTPLTIKLDDGTEHEFADVLSQVIGYWQTTQFP